MSATLLAGAIIFETAGTISLKVSDGFRRKIWMAPFATSYIIAFIMLALVINEGVPIGVAYGIWAATGVALTAVLGRLLFREPLTPLMELGITAIAAGVLAIELSLH
ncbi:DMT family transporter [Pseudonocardia alni]|uniref:DMT family transporter n=1 Tax=Pseudonocardia alni TaxID=33907 RepID=UPI00280B2760|nr:multidrug efflux SMR transporter [Pseudonocardia alni]